MAYNDSRYSASRWYRKLHLNWIFSTSTFVGNVLLALLAAYLFSHLNYDEAVNYVFFVSFLAVGLWVTEAIPPFAVGIFIIAFLLLGFGTDYILEGVKTPVEMYLGTWTSNVIWLLLGGFFLAEGMHVVGLDKDLFRFTVNTFGKKPAGLLLGLMTTTAIGSMVMSNTATTAMMVSSILPLTRFLGKQSRYTAALLIGIPAAATLGGMGTIIGSTPNAIAVGALKEAGVNITFIEWMAFGVPSAIIATYLFWWFLIRRYRLKELQMDMPEFKEEEKKAGKIEKNSVIFTLALTIIMWMTEPLHGIPLGATSAIPIVLLTLFQVVKAENVRRLPWDTLMLVAGGLALGIAMVDVGLTDIVMGGIQRLELSNYIIVLIFSLLAVMVSNIMSNTAASSILIPLGLALPGAFGLVVPLVVALSCSCALFLPVSTPPNAISYATGMVEQNEFQKGGLLMVVLGPILAILSALLWIIFFN